MRWTIVEEDSNSEEKKTDINDDKKERSKIRNVISYTLPYLKSTYIQKLVQTCMTDIIRWDKSLNLCVHGKEILMNGRFFLNFCPVYNNGGATF